MEPWGWIIAQAGKMAWHILLAQPVREDVVQTYSAAAAMIGSKKAKTIYRLWEEESDAMTRAGDPVRMRPAAFKSFLRKNGVHI